MGLGKGGEGKGMREERRKGGPSSREGRRVWWWVIFNKFRKKNIKKLNYKNTPKYILKKILNPNELSIVKVLHMHWCSKVFKNTSKNT